MRVKHDLRAELGIVVSRCNELLSALQQLPDTEDAMLIAAQALSRQERAQTVEYLTAFCQRLYVLREHGLWAKRMLSEGL
jgi:hypothetical protein